MSEQKEAVAGTSSRRPLYAAPIYNCLKLWAFRINSTLATWPPGMPSHPGRLRGCAIELPGRRVPALAEAKCCAPLRNGAACFEARQKPQTTHAKSVGFDKTGG